MEALCRFGPVTVLFQDLPVDPLWPFWCWKLDPFRIESGTPDLIVSFNGRLIGHEDKPIWAAESAKVCKTVHRLADGTLVWQQTDAVSKAIQLQYAVSADWSKIILTQDHSNTLGMGAFEFLTFLIHYAFLHKGVLTFHGVLLETERGGVLLCADSGVGKTTHARLWRDHKNALILNGDRAACFCSKGRWFGFGTPWCGTSGEYLNRTVPLRAIVVLERGTEDRISPVNAMAVLHHAVYPSWDKASTESMLSLLDGFLENVSVLRLECTPNLSAAEVLDRALEKLPL